MDYRALLRSCRQRIDALEERVTIPEPFDLDVFLERLAEARGRPVEVRAVAQAPDGTCGLCVVLDDRDVIMHAAATSAAHRDHIVLHEVGHLLCGHVDGMSLTESARADLLPHLDPALVQRVLGRSAYRAEEEQEAEMIATLLMERGLRTGRRHAPAPAGDPDDVVSRIASTFGVPPEHGRGL